MASAAAPSFVVPAFRDLTVTTRRGSAETPATATEILYLRGSRQRHEYRSRTGELSAPVTIVACDERLTIQLHPGPNTYSTSRIESWSERVNRFGQLPREEAT